jgi:hypothetical protein
VYNPGVKIMSYDFNKNGQIDSGIEEWAQKRLDDGDGNFELIQDVGQDMLERYGIKQAGKAVGNFVTDNLENIDELGDAAGWIGKGVKLAVNVIGNILF